MKHTAVTSSNILSVGYDGKTLEVAFKDKNGNQSGLYEYDSVPAGVSSGLLTASSKGEYFAQHIKGKYAYRKVG